MVATSSRDEYHEAHCDKQTVFGSACSKVSEVWLVHHIEESRTPNTFLGHKQGLGIIDGALKKA